MCTVYPRASKWENIQYCLWCSLCLILFWVCPYSRVDIAGRHMLFLIHIFMFQRFFTNNNRSHLGYLSLALHPSLSLSFSLHTRTLSHNFYFMLSLTLFLSFDSFRRTLFICVYVVFPKRKFRSKPLIRNGTDLRAYTHTREHILLDVKRIDE